MCLNPLTIKNPRIDFNPYIDAPFLQVPCNKCWECQCSKLSDLEARAVAQYEYTKEHGGMVFNYTLTYDEEHVPWYMGIRVLCRRDMQLFKKRFKKSLGDVSDKVHIAYFGEVGKNNTKRSHFHILIYCDIPFDACAFAKLVRKAWQNGFIGYPKKLHPKTLKPLRPHPAHAVVTGVNALRYCIKYCAKGFEIRQYLYESFLNWLSEHDIKDLEVDNFVFPEFKRFKFSQIKDINLDYIVNYFSSCYRVFNDFGKCQYDKLDENYDYVSKIPFHGDVKKYHITKYCKNKYFKVSKDINNHKQSFYTDAWIHYNLKVSHKFALDFQNYYLSNQFIKLDNTELPYDFVKDALANLHAFCDIDLYTYNLYRRFYPTVPLSTLPISTSLELRKNRTPCYINMFDNDPLYDLIPTKLNDYDSILLNCRRAISYQKYLKKYDSDINYQNVKSALYGSNPQYPKLLTFNQLIYNYDSSQTSTG